MSYLEFKAYACACTSLYITLALGCSCRRFSIVLLALILAVGLLLVELLESNHWILNL